MEYVVLAEIFFKEQSGRMVARMLKMKNLS